jgi:FkbM family methyltransferase
MKVLANREYSFESDHQSPAFIVDAGANIGLATLYFAWKYPAARIAAIEPEASNLEILRRNCADLPSVKIIPSALWSGRSNLFISNPHSEKWTFSVTEKKSSGPSIPSVTVGDVLRDSGFDRIDILKLDIEGAERELFREGWQDWLPKVRMIVIELHDRFLPGCSHAFYSAILSRPFRQEINGENVLIEFDSF